MFVRNDVVARFVREHSQCWREHRRVEAAPRNDLPNRRGDRENSVKVLMMSQIHATLPDSSSFCEPGDRAPGRQCANGDIVDAVLPKVLMIDDDRFYRSELSCYVRSNGFDSLEYDSFAAALEFVRTSRCAFVILPELAVGSRHLFDYIAAIKRAHNASVLVLSNRSEETEKVVALELGADDFIPKSADRREILARIRAAVRRLLHPQTAIALRDDGAAAGMAWRFEQGRRELIDPGGWPVRLTNAEFTLLDAFVRHTGYPLSRDHLSIVVLGRPHNASDRGIDNLVAKLRHRLGDSARLARMIKTARPVGYVFTGFIGEVAQPKSEAAIQAVRRGAEWVSGIKNM